MGRVIKPDTEGAATAALTETGKGGLLSTGYLRDDPAGEYVGDGETPAYVVTNASEGVVRTRDGQETAITPGDGYRTIAVVTDRRGIVLVGNADDGDERITLPLVEVADARATDGDLVVAMDGGERWRVPVGDGTVADVAAYADAVAGAWDEMEAALDSVKRSLVAATAYRDDGEYEAGIGAAQDAYDELAGAAAVVDDLDDEWPTAALHNRVDSVRLRCVSTLAEVRIGHGRAIADRAEARWREGGYEAAHDAYDRARAEFEAVAALDGGSHGQADAVEDGLARIDRAIQELRAAPLERAIEADRRAREAEDRPSAIIDWRLARERYLETLELDADEPERRFEGDPVKIRERVETVTERVLQVAREDGAEALSAGQWHLEAGKPGVAGEELRAARDVFERALPVAREVESAPSEELEEWLAEAEAALEDAEAARADAGLGDERGTGAGPSEARGGDGTAPLEPAEGGGPSVPDEEEDAEQSGGDRPDDASPLTESSSGPLAVDGAAPPADADGPRGTGEAGIADDIGPVEEGVRSALADESATVVSDGAGTTIDAPTADPSLENHLRALDPAGFSRLARSLLEADGTEPTAAAEAEPYDFHVAGPDGDEAAVVRTIHRPLAGPIDADEIEATATIAALRNADGMVVTSSSLTDEASEVAAAADVRVTAREEIAAALEGQAPGPFGREHSATDE